MVDKDNNRINKKNKIAVKKEDKNFEIKMEEPKMVIQYNPSNTSGSALRTNYENLKKKYRLPDYDELNREFELDSIKETDFTLRRICARLTQIMNSLTKVLENQLEGQSVSSTYESRMMSAKEKEELFEFYKKTMMLVWAGNEAIFSHNETIESDFIRIIAKEWPLLKNYFQKLSGKMKNNWKDLSLTKKQDFKYYR